MFTKHFHFNFMPHQIRDIYTKISTRYINKISKVFMRIYKDKIRSTNTNIRYQ